MKSKYILIAAFVMAIITTILFRQYIVGLSNKYKNSQKTVSIVVSKVDIKKNQVVTKDMLEIKQFHTDSVHPQALKKIDDIVGEYALTDIKAGEVLFASRFTNQFKENQLITRKIRDGYRAIAIAATDVEAVSDLIQPEDYVDVIYTQVNKSDPNNTQTVVLLQNIRVLAVGKRISETASASTNSSNSTNSTTGTDKTAQNNQTSGDYASVTLELKPEDVVKIANADEKGDIKFVLRSQLTP